MASDISKLPFDILENIVECMLAGVAQSRIYPCAEYLCSELDFYWRVERSRIWKRFTHVNTGLRAIGLPYSLRGILPTNSEFLSFASGRSHLAKHVRFLKLTWAHSHKKPIEQRAALNALKAFTSLVELAVWTSAENGLFDLRGLTCMDTLTSLRVVGESPVILPDLTQFPEFCQLRFDGHDSELSTLVVSNHGDISPSLSRITTLCLYRILFDPFLQLIARSVFPSLRSLYLWLRTSEASDPWPVVSRFISRQPRLHEVATGELGHLPLESIISLMVSDSEIEVNEASDFDLNVALEFSFEREYDKSLNAWRVISLIILEWRGDSVVPRVDSFNKAINICDSVTSLTVRVEVGVEIRGLESSFVAYMHNVAFECGKWTKLEYLNISYSLVAVEWGCAEDWTLRWNCLSEYLSDTEPPFNLMRDEEDTRSYVLEEVELVLLRRHTLEEVRQIMGELRKAHDLVYPGRRERLMIAIWEICHKSTVARAVEEIAQNCPSLRQFDWDMSVIHVNFPCVWRWDIERLEEQKVRLYGRLFYDLAGGQISNNGVPRWEVVVGSGLVGNLLREANEIWSYGPLW